MFIIYKFYKINIKLNLIDVFFKLGMKLILNMIPKKNLIFEKLIY